jgi:quercetin dioxygenase-like cupin family protein
MPTDIATRPRTAEELVTYQDGSVVSKALVAKTAGTVTLFAFASGQGLSEHTAPYDALVFVIDGEAEITVAGKNHRVARGQVLLLPANDPHALQATSPFKMLLTMIKS